MGIRKKKKRGSHVASVRHNTNDLCLSARGCPKRHPSPQLPSPVACLSQASLKKVMKEIKKTNELLLDLALGDDRPLHETYQKIFDGLLNIQVAITRHSDETTVGIITLAGYDFVVVQEGSNYVILPYHQIKTINPYDQFTEPYHPPKFTHAPSCLREDLIYHFGKTVSSSPQLIHLFFRMRLDILLLKYVDTQIRVRILEKEVEGTLSHVNKDGIVLNLKCDQLNIPFDQISFIILNSSIHKCI